ncbi:F-box protein CPR1-like [Lycium ferocissimum]|uniref:F-box protein CPR1-like n=1 Tax=Lycium ferocissimum TaxID=112874 RepID=UPI002814BE59|nr:F-box protein CPR1-like [Lycium ferocissimum]
MPYDGNLEHLSIPLLVGDSYLGLGYDSTTGDYKSLKVRTDIDGREVPSEILPLKSGSWRNTDKHPHGKSNVLFGMDSLAFVHEAFHWIGIFGNCSTVSFTISNEEYGEIPLPEQILCLRGNISVGVPILECFCVHSTSTCWGKETFKLWVLKDYGGKESWNALFILENP